MAKINSVKPILPQRTTTNGDLLLFNDKRTTPMKVTVKFGSTSVVVPVSNGMLVSDLIQASVHRYKKVANKPIDTWVDVKHLQSSTGGILYTDDPLIHVVDDKEQIVAIFDEQDAPIHHSYIFPHNIDGGSAGTTSNSPDFVRSSSTNSSAGSNGTGSGGGVCGSGSGRNYIRNFNHAPPCPPVVPPRYFQKDRKSTDDHDGINKTTIEHYSKRNLNINRPQDASNSVVVKRLDDIPTSTSLLVVRRGSEPALNGPIDDYDDENGNIQKINVVDQNSSSTSTITTPNKVKWPTHPDLASEGRSSTDIEEDTSRRVYASDMATGMGKFVRSVGPRKSHVTQEMFEMAVQLAEEREMNRHDAAHDDDDDADVDVSFSAGQEKHKRFDIQRIIVKFKNDRKPLGVQVLPEYDGFGKLNCLIVKHIQPGMLIADDGQVQIYDRIVDVNDHSISEMSFVGAQTFLHNASNQGHLSLKIERQRSENTSTDIVNSSKNANDDTSLPNENGGASINGTNQSAATLLSNLQKANTRKIGKVLTLEIIKGSDGLGFTLTSRDNAAIGDNFTCIKNILPRGSAIKDGRLKEGDRILEINCVEVTGMAKEKVVSMLRDVKEGDVVKLVVSRQENVAGSLSPVLPRQLPLDKANVDSLGSERYKQRLVFEIPLNDSGSAGLGVSVKGRTANDPSVSREHQHDCGIFIKTIMHGGAAHKDSRLKINDQLIAVNEIDLTNLSNKDAMNRLRAAMQELDPSASCIKLIVLRTIPSSSGIFDASTSSTLRPMTPPMSPSTPDGGASLLLEMPGSYSPVSIKSDAIRRPLHYLVPGYGDYAIVVKDPLSHAPTLSLGSRAEECVVIEDDEMRMCLRRTSSDVPDTKSETSGVEETDYYQTVNDPFVRDAPNRQSMSEKRHGGGKIDPAHTLTFQKIQHTRQTSAPSLQDPPQDSSTPIRYKVDQSLMDYSPNVSSMLTVERRSLSLESLGPSTLAAVQQQQMHQYYPTTSNDRPLIHEKIAQNVLRNSNLHGPPSKVKSKSKLSAAQRARMTNESFRAAVDKSYDENGLEVAVDVGMDGTDSPLESPMDAPQNGLSSGPRTNIVNKDQRRRKSTGNGLSTLKSLFRFGSGGKSSKQLGLAYEEKRAGQQQIYEAELQEKARRHAEEEQKKIRAHYERLKEQEHQRQHSPQRQRGVSPNKQRVLMHPSSMSPLAQPHFVNAAHPKMPSHWKPPVPPPPISSPTYTPPLQTHQSSHQMQMRYHSPSDPTQLSSGTMYHRANGQNYSAKNYDTDDGYGDLNVAIVETNRCYRSLERPSAQSVATAGTQRSTVVQSYDKPSAKDTGMNNQNQRNRQLIPPSHQPHHSYGRSADDDWPSFDRPPKFIGNFIGINHYQHHISNGNKNGNVQYAAKQNRDQFKLNSSTSSTIVTVGDQMPPIPPPDYDQYLRTSSKPKMPRKPRPASDYIGNMNHKATSLPRRPPKHQQQYFSKEPEKGPDNIPTSYDSYGSLPRNGHYTTVRM